MRFRATLAAIVILLALAPAASAASPTVVEEANAFMEAYASGNWEAVKSHLSEHVFIYGSDISEFAESAEGFKTIFDNDQKLWRGAAHFGDISQVSTFAEGRVASLFFTREFKLGTTVLRVRVATVWHKERGRWKLVQSSNAVPSVGQSAADILKQAAPN